MRLFHVSILSIGSLRILPEPADRLRVIRRIARFLGPRLLWFGIEDTHAHILTEGEPDRMRIVARDLACILARNGGVDFRPPFVQPIANRRHLENCWPYVLGNAEVHRLPPGEAWLDASGVPDLVGARVLPGFDPERWKVHLPRKSLGEMMATLGLQVPAPVPVEDLRSIGATRIVRAAAAAVGWPDLGRNVPAVAAARVCAVSLARSAGIAASEVAHGLDVDPRIVRRLAQRTADPAIALATRVRLALEVITRGP